MQSIAIFASGTGSNARKIIEHFKGHADIRVGLIVTNKKDAGVLEIARKHGIPTLTLNRYTFYETDYLLTDLRKFGTDLIALAGFLWLVPKYLLEAFPQRIVNIHPALLPKFGGKGMFGMHVHEAVKNAGENESGMTIHFVNENYDEGDIIFQAKTAISPTDSAADIAKKVLALEHRYFPVVIENLLVEK